MKIHSPSRSLATVCNRWWANSSSLRVGAIVGARMRPVATSKLAIRLCVPWRT